MDQDTASANPAASTAPTSDASAAPAPADASAAPESTEAPAPETTEPKASAPAAPASSDALAVSAETSKIMIDVAEKIAGAQNVLVALSSDPSVDELSAAIGLSLFLNRLGKRASAIYSGTTPNVLEFLKPGEIFETSADTLQDFVIALNKDKADHLRYKLDGDFVKIFITPYKTKISQEDLAFSYGDYNVDLVLALDVANGVDLDSALREHGRIMHDAVIINITTGNPGKLGEVEWSEKTASSVSEMIARLLYTVTKETIEEEEATAFLTGIVAATNRFSNARTTPETMQVASQLMRSGANQQLVSKNITPEIDNELLNALKENGNTAENKTIAAPEVELTPETDKAKAKAEDETAEKTKETEETTESEVKEENSEKAVDKEEETIEKAEAKEESTAEPESKAEDESEEKDEAAEAKEVETESKDDETETKEAEAEPAEDKVKAESEPEPEPEKPAEDSTNIQIVHEKGSATSTESESKPESDADPIETESETKTEPETEIKEPEAGEETKTETEAPAESEPAETKISLSPEEPIATAETPDETASESPAESSTAEEAPAEAKIEPEPAVSTDTATGTTIEAPEAPTEALAETSAAEEEISGPIAADEAPAEEEISGPISEAETTAVAEETTTETVLEPVSEPAEATTPTVEPTPEIEDHSSLLDDLKAAEQSLAQSGAEIAASTEEKPTDPNANVPISALDSTPAIKTESASEPAPASDPTGDSSGYIGENPANAGPDGEEETVVNSEDEGFITAAPEKIVQPSPDANFDSNPTEEYGKMLETALDSAGAPIENNQTLISPPENPAQAAAPTVPANPEINGVPEINYAPASTSEILPPPPAPPIELTTSPMNMPPADTAVPAPVAAEPAPAATTAPAADPNAFKIPGM